MAKSLSVSELRLELLKIKCLEPNKNETIFYVKDTDKKYQIALEDGSSFYIYSSHPEEYIVPKRFSFLKKYFLGNNFIIYRISIDVFLREIPEEYCAEILFHLNIFT